MEGENFRGKGQEKCEENGHGAGSSSSAANPPNPSPRNTFSKYDFVKVRVWLGENADHYYVLSRFLMSRMLTVTKIPHHVAIKIALELKKLLVDNSLLDVSQSDLEANLFKLMERRGYGEEYISRYKMMTRFHHQRVPFVILVCGTACVGKSTIATQLAQRLNLPNVLQTDMVYELLRTSTDAPLASTPIWTRDFNSPEELVTEFCRECRIVRKGLAGDLKKAVKDGKPIIIEGIHLDPSIYLMDEENQESNVGIAKQPSLKQMVADNDTSESKDDMKDCQSGDFISTAKCNSVVMVEKKHSLDTLTVDRQFKANMATVDCDAQSTSKSVDNLNDQSAELPNSPSESKEKTEKTATKPIIVPIVLKMADFDHKAVLEEWLSSRSLSESLKKDSEKVINNFKTIQSYLCSFESQGMTVVNTSATTFPQTLDWLHNHLLQCIERGCSLANPEAGS